MRWCIQGNKENQEEPEAKRVAKRADRASSPSKKKKVRGGGKFPPVRVSDNLHRKVIVLNVVGLLCDIRPLHDRREWGADLVVHYAQEHKVKIKKRADCGPFLTMLCSRFDVGIWSPIDHSLLEVVAQFLASRIGVKWSFCGEKKLAVAKEISMISLARCVWNQLLQLDAFRSIAMQPQQNSPPL